MVMYNHSDNNGMEMQVTLEDTKKASVLLIRKLFLLMQNLDDLPDNVYLTMKLYYYDDGEARSHQPLSAFLPPPTSQNIFPLSALHSHPR